MIVDIQNRCMTWQLDRPENGNGFDEAVMAEMEVALEKLETLAEDLSCLVIQGDETVFSTGLDSGMVEVCFKDRAQFSHVVRRMSGVLERLATLPQVTIACLEGECRLGGLELALACDLIVASEGAHISDGHLAYDAMPGGGATKRLPARIGYGRSLLFLLESPVLSAEEALKAGLVDDLVQSGCAHERGKAIAQLVTSRDPVLVREMKASLRAGCPVSDDLSYLEAFQRSVIERLVAG